MSALDEFIGALKKERGCGLHPTAACATDGFFRELYEEAKKTTLMESDPDTIVPRMFLVAGVIVYPGLSTPYPDRLYSRFVFVYQNSDKEQAAMSIDTKDLKTVRRFADDADVDKQSERQTQVREMQRKINQAVKNLRYAEEDLLKRLEPILRPEGEEKAGLEEKEHLVPFAAELSETLDHIEICDGILRGILNRLEI